MSAHAGFSSLLLFAALALRIMSATGPGRPRAPGAGRGHAGGDAASQVAVLAGGCFWGVQGVFQHVKGVSNALSGYAGGAKSTAVYELTNDGTTGHAESVQVTFDPRRSPTDNCCRSSSPSRTIRRNSIGRAPTPGRSIGQRSSRPTPNRPRSRRPTSHSSTDQGVQEAHRDDDRDGPRRSTRPRSITRIFSSAIHVSLHRLQRFAED